MSERPTARNPPQPPRPSPRAPGSSEGVGGSAQAREQALARLLTRISSHADFPSLKESIASIQQIVRSEQAHMRALTEGVLKDVALTTKLLRLINSACYRAVGAGSISSVQRALSLMGFQTVGMIAASLILFERLPKGIDGARVREEFSHALLAGLLAQEMCHSGRHLEHSYLTAVFMNLGRMLVSLHFPEAAQAIDDTLRDRLQATGMASEGPQAHAQRMRISLQTLGLSTEDLGDEVAQLWGWPDDLRDQLRRLYPSGADQAVAEDDYLRVLATAASDLSVQLHRLKASSSAEDEPALQRACVARFHRAWGMPLSRDEADMAQAVERALEQWFALAVMLGLDSVLGRQRQQLKPTVAVDSGERPAGHTPPGPKPSRAATYGPVLVAPLAPGAPALPGAAASAGPHAPLAPPALQPPTHLDALSQVVARASEQALSNAAMDEVAQAILDDLRAALLLQRVVLCLRTSSGTLQGRYGSGAGMPSVLGHFHVPLGRSQDLFSVLCALGKDTLISDTRQPNIDARLPPWFRPHFDASTFLLLPLKPQAQIAGLLYADRGVAGSLQLDERLLSMLSVMRNQVLLALKLRGLV
jgi:HD-like signal output (HDOD) protein